MRPGIIDLREFYATPRGRTAARSLSRALSAMRRGITNPAAPLVAYGYAVPVLTNATPEALHLMPEAQGLAAWPDASRNRTQAASDTRWPLPEASVGTVLLMHALEHAAEPLALLAEAWRVLQGQGQLWLVVPNRQGLWSRADGTPFGHGTPYSATQLRRLLRAASFVPEAWRRTLYLPPFKSPLALGTAPAWELLGPQLMAPYGGLLLLRATKQVYAPVGLAAAAETDETKGFALLPQPAPAGCTYRKLK